MRAPELTFERMLVTTGGEAPGWFNSTDLRLSSSGFVAIDKFLQAVPGVVFAAGDCAHFTERPLNKSGVYAVRQGPTLIANLREAVVGSQRRERYIPQRQTLSLLIAGDRKALGSYGPFAFTGGWVWRWKDRIDRKFMQRFGERAVVDGGMNVNTCGGCGGKASAQTVNELVKSLVADSSSLVPAQTEDVGYLGDMAVTVDGFRTFTQDLFLFGEVAVLHALNDLFACGARPAGVTVMVTLPPARNKIRSNQLLHLMKGVLAALAEHGISLLNAHTAEGSEVSLSITALGSAGRRWKKQGLAPGQVLILTKPLGTGALLQGWMQGRLSEVSFLALRESLLQSHGTWLAQNSTPVAAATDISGFGLIGHLSEMMGGVSPVRAVLDKATIGCLPAFSDLELNGVGAFMTAQNHAAYSGLIDGGEIEKHASLLYDPQTNKRTTVVSGDGRPRG